MKSNCTSYNSCCSESIGRSDWFQTSAVRDIVWHSWAGDRDKLFAYSQSV